MEQSKMTKKRNYRKMLVIQINEELHKELKTNAALRNISMSLLVHRAVYRFLMNKDKEDTSS